VDASPPAVGYKFPNDNPSPGGAVAAKVIGQQCAGVLSDADIRELDRYLKHRNRAQIIARQTSLTRPKKSRRSCARRKQATLKEGLDACGQARRSPQGSTGNGARASAKLRVLRHRSPASVRPGADLLV
jgi:hypothetical protein